MERQMRKIAVAGIGTDVGKTIVSAILAYALNADYWKPIQCGLSRDRETVDNLLKGCRKIHDEGLFLKAPVSPHHAAKLEGFDINPEQIDLPNTSRPLIIEGCGGVFVPLNSETLMIDLCAKWGCEWVVVSRHYLGSINHTLLTLDAMKKRSLCIRGIIFNGERCIDTEAAILKFSNLPCIGRLNLEPQWNLEKVQFYAKTWKASKAFQNAMLQ
jgi:dethiobiotin synthetase